MHINLPSISFEKTVRILSVGALCLLGSFILGIETAGEVHPFEASKAVSPDEEAAESAGQEPGDIDGNGQVDIKDAIAILEIVQGYEEASPLQLDADPNGDSRLTTEDALRILRTIAVR